MPRVELDVETTLPPERVREALLDFSKRRPDVWPDLEPSLYEVYTVGETTAEIKEGTKGPGMTVWARERYDWSRADAVRWTVVESNFCEPGSFVEATLAPREGGGTRIHVEWERRGTTPSSRLGLRLVTLTRGAPVRRSLQKGLDRLERG